jgi:PPOX class probable F420-dependent enzyme
MTAERARALFSSAEVARLATIGAGGAPHLVPVTFVVAIGARGAADAIYTAVDDKPKRTSDLRRLRNVRARPAVCLLADRYEDDWDRLWWARADGRARVLASDEPEAADAGARLAERYAQYARRPPRGPVIAVDVERWSGWQAREEPGPAG